MVKSFYTRYREHRQLFKGISLWQLLMMRLIRIARKRLINRGVIDTAEKPRKSLKLYMDPFSNSEGYKDLICISGLGWSGSGAVEDLLSEYENVSVLACVEDDSSCRQKELSFDFEFDFLRNPGGLFSLERNINIPYVAENDTCVHQFVSYVADLYFGPTAIFESNFVSLTRKFLDEIIDFKIAKKSSTNGRLNTWGNRGIHLIWPDLVSGPFDDFYFCTRSMPVSEYRRIAGEYIRGVLHRIPSKKSLVLDQFLSDGTGDVQKYIDYLGNVKIICVYRDPRDVYCSNLRQPEGWIPVNVPDFIKWYLKVTTQYLSAEHPNLLKIRFEDLVMNCDCTVKTIENFLGWSSTKHTRPLSALNPSISRKNVGIWRDVLTDNENRQICDVFGSLCYTVLGNG